MLNNLLVVGGTFLFVIFAIHGADVFIAHVRRDAWLRGLTLVSLRHTVYTQNGQVQPGGKVFFDSAVVVIEATFHGPEGKKPFPFELCAQFITPDGTDQWYRVPVSTSGGPAMTVTVSRNASELTDKPGHWQVYAHVTGIGAFPVVLDIVVPQYRSPEADLKLVATDVSALLGGRRHHGDVVVTGSERVEFRALLKPRSLPLDKFEGITTTLRLACARANCTQCSSATALPPHEGQLCVAFVLDSILETHTKWDIRLSVEERTIYEGHVFVVSPDQAAKRVEVCCFQLMGVDNSGMRVPLGKVIYASEIHSVIPVLRLRTAYPTPLLHFRADVEMTIEESLLFADATEIVMGNAEETVQLEAIPVPRPPKSQHRQTCFIQVSLEGRCLVRRELLLKAAPPKFAAMQERLLRSGRTLEEVP